MFSSLLTIKGLWFWKADWRILGQEVWQHGCSGSDAEAKEYYFGTPVWSKTSNMVSNAWRWKKAGFVSSAVRMVRFAVSTKLNDRQLGVILNIMSWWYHQCSTMPKRWTSIYMARVKDDTQGVNIKLRITWKLWNQESDRKQAKTNWDRSHNGDVRGKSVEVPHKKSGLVFQSRNLVRTTIWLKTSLTWLTNRTVHMVDIPTSSHLICHQTRLIGLLLTPWCSRLRCSSILQIPRWSEDDWGLTDGSEAAKKMMINKTAKMLDTRATTEMSGPIAHIASPEEFLCRGWGICSKTPVQ